MQAIFTGKASLNKMDSKFPYYAEGTTKNGDKYHRFNLIVTDNKNNRIMTELFGMEQKEIKTMDTDNQKLSINWDQRDNKDIIASVANYRKNVFTFVDDERKEFIAPYDAVQYLRDNVDDLNNNLVTVACNVNANYYKGKISYRYEIKNIYPLSEERKQQLQITGDFYFNKDSIDTSEWNESKKLILNGYVQMYIAEKKKNIYIPQTIVLDCGKADLKNENHIKQIRFKLSCINCDLKDGKITTKLKSNTMYKIGVELRYYNSAQEVEITEDMLTDKQRMAIEVGLKSIQDFQVKAYGERVILYKLTDFQIQRQDYSDGCIDLEIKPSEFEDDVFVGDEEESEDILEGAMNPPEDEEDNLFDD